MEGKTTHERKETRERERESAEEVIRARLSLHQRITKIGPLIGEGTGTAARSKTDIFDGRARAEAGVPLLSTELSFHLSPIRERAEREIEDERLIEFRVEIFPFPNSVIRGASSSVYQSKNNLNAALFSAPCHYLKIIFEKSQHSFQKELSLAIPQKRGIGHSHSLSETRVRRRWRWRERERIRDE